MKEVSILLADRIYQTLQKIREITKLKAFETRMNALALESIKQGVPPNFIGLNYDVIIGRIDEKEKKVFLMSCGKIYFALLQKYIRVRKGELLP